MGRTAFHEEFCKGCGLCIEVCPKKILAFASGRLNSKGYPPVECTDAAECTACALCARNCPDSAIDVYREVKGS